MTRLQVHFLKSQRSVDWTDSSESLLVAAETAGIDAPFACRSGVCGTCVTRLTAGAVRYTAEPLCDLAAD